MRSTILLRFCMALISEEDVRDLKFQREIEVARDVFLLAGGEERSTAKSRYLKLLRAFSERVLDRRKNLSSWHTES